MKKQILSFLAVRLTALAMVIGFSGTLKAAETINLNIGTLAGGETALVNTLKHWATQMNKMTEGRVVIRILANGTAGDEATIMQSLKDGKLDGAALSAWTLATVEQDILAACLPNKFAATSNYFMFLQFFQDQLSEGFSEKGFFLADLTLGADGYLVSKEKLNTPDAFKKGKLAVKNSVDAAYWGHFGVKTYQTKPMDFTADYQSGKFSAAIMSPLLLKQLNMGKLPRSEQSFVWEPWGVVFSDASWKKLSTADQRTLIQGLERLMYGACQKALQAQNQFRLTGFKESPVFDIESEKWKKFLQEGKDKVMQEMISEKLRTKLAEMTWD